MIKLLIPFIALFPFFALAQGPFTVTGSGAAFKNGDKMYLVYRAGDAVITDSLTVANGAFTFKGAIAGPTKATLYKNENPLTAEEVFDALGLYIEPGNITVTTQDSLKNGVLSGTQTNIDLVELNTTLKPLRKQQWQVIANFEALPPEQQKDVNRVAAFRAQVKAITQQMLPQQFMFVNQHPASYISLATLQELQRNTDIAMQVEDAYNNLDAALRQTPLGKQLGAAVQASVKSAIGNPAINFTQPGTSGQPVQLAAFKGKYVLVDFWASWCSPCRAENPFIVAAYNKYKNKGFSILGVSLDDTTTKATWLKAIKKDGLAWTHVSDLKGWQNQAAALYGIKGIPANILISPAGIIIAKNIKDKTLDETLEGLLGK